MSAAPDISGFAAVRGARILLAEDNLLNQQIACELLADEGLVVEVATNGREALEMALSRRYDLVLMDMQVPEMDGLAATRALRERFSTAELPILAMTANASEADRRRCAEAGMDAHISKPIDPPQLYATLQRWLRPPALPVLAADAGYGSTVPSSQMLGVAGIDSSLGLRRAGGKPALYRKLLAIFVRDMASSVDAVRSALGAGDRAAAVRAAHSLKGSAGTIGAGALESAAGALEARLAAGQDPEPLALAMLAADLASLVACIEGALTTMPAAVPAVPEGNAAAHGATANDSPDPVLLRRVEALLASDDTAAAGLIDEHAGALRAQLGPMRFEALRQAIDGYDFEAALAAFRGS